MSVADRKPEQGAFEVIVVGAGFAGLAALRKVRDELGLSVRGIEAAGGAGGVWYWNRYPGARCDVESLQYSYAFSEELAQDWNWTERFATQPEILSYVSHVVDRFDLAKDINFDTRVVSTVFDEATARWTLKTDRGDEYTAHHVIMATGPLSSTNIPDFPGRDSFKGEVYHTGQWPHTPVSFEGKKVAVIGTGSSGVQAAPVIARTAAHLYVMQRTPGHSVPAANRMLNPGEQEAVKARYGEFRKMWNATVGATMWRSLPTDEVVVTGDKGALEVSEEERRATFDRAWKYGGTGFIRSFNDILVKEEASLLANDYIASKIREIVKDPKVAELVTPKQYFGTKRLILDSGYYEMFNQPNVTLVDVKSDPIERLTESGIITRSGATYDVDLIVFATGYDAMTGSLTRMGIKGRDGAALSDVWAGGPQSYLGLMVAGFPNLYIVAGPQSPSVLANVIAANEHQVGWIAERIKDLNARGVATIEPTPEAQAAWVQHVNEVGAASIYTKGDSWYVGANIEGKAKAFLPYIGFPRYVAKCDEVVAKGYEGFVLTQRAKAEA
jgi:cation diffusion facilitator CzcD-associated flavoprotein CzcO